MTHLVRPALALMLLLPLTSFGADSYRFEEDEAAVKPSLPEPSHGAVWAPDPAKTRFKAGELAIIYRGKNAKVAGVGKDIRDLEDFSKFAAAKDKDGINGLHKDGRYALLTVGTSVRIIGRHQEEHRYDGDPYYEARILDGPYAKQLAVVREKDVVVLIEVDDDDPATDRFVEGDAPVDAPPVLGYPPVGGNVVELLRKDAIRDREMATPDVMVAHEKRLAKLKARLDEPTRRRIYAEQYRALIYAGYQANLAGSGGDSDAEFAVNRREIIARYRVDPTDIWTITVEGKLASWPLPAIPSLSDEEARASYRIVPPPAKKKVTTPKAKP